MRQNPRIANIHMIGREPLEKNLSGSDVDFLKDALTQPALLLSDIVRRVREIDRNDAVRRYESRLAALRQREFVHVHGRRAVARLHGGDDAVVAVDDDAGAEGVACVSLVSSCMQRQSRQESTNLPADSQPSCKGDRRPDTSKRGNCGH